jgi:hypothetical protein
VVEGDRLSFKHREFSSDVDPLVVENLDISSFD